MKTLIIVLSLLSLSFCDNAKITCEDRSMLYDIYKKNPDTMLTYNDLLYRPQGINYYPFNPYANDTIYTVENKDGEYLIIRKYEVVDTVKVKVTK